MSGNTPKQPKYGKHSSGQARVVIAGRVVYLGRHGSRESYAEYDRVIAEWRATGSARSPAEAELSIDELFLRYWRHVETYYQKNGKPTTERYLIRQALRFAREQFGTTPAASFGPLKLKAVRDQMLAKGTWSRGTINKMITRVKGAFQWGGSEEIIPPSLHHGLGTVKGLKCGRNKARETAPKRPVPEFMLNATRPHVSKPIGAMIDLQLLTGMRPGEVCIMRACDLETTGNVWVYRPETHKTEHHDRNREIYLGPRAQEILKPFLQLDTQAYLFSPADADAERQKQRRAARKTPLYPSHARQLAKKRKTDRGRAPGDRYDPCSYRHAIDWACVKAFPLPEHLAPCVLAGGKRETAKVWKARLTPQEMKAVRTWRKNHSWHPNRLRHNAGTNLRKEFGIELARIILGHAHGFTTEIYAEADRNQAIDVIAKIG